MWTESTFQSLVHHFRNEKANTKEPVEDENENKELKGEVKVIPR